MAPSSDKAAAEKAKASVLQRAINTFSLTQNLLTGSGVHNQINIRSLKIFTFHESNLTAGMLKKFVEYQGPLGISGGYDPHDQSLRALALACDGHCLIVEFGESKMKKQRSKRDSVEQTETDQAQDLEGRRRLGTVLIREEGVYAFDMGPLSMALYRDLGIRITSGVDIQTAFPNEKEPHRRKTPIDAIKACVGDHLKVNNSNIVAVFQDLTYNRLDTQMQSEAQIVQRAWVSHYLPTFENGAETFDPVPQINTDTLSEIVGV